jgi:hypothetical protein
LTPKSSQKKIVKHFTPKNQKQHDKKLTQNRNQNLTKTKNKTRTIDFNKISKNLDPKQHHKIDSKKEVNI